MAAQDKQRSGAVEWAGRGVEAIRAGRLSDGRDHLLKAIDADKRNPFYRFDLALAQQGLGDIEAAARELCAAIRLKPDFDDASRRLGMLAARYQFDSADVLDPFALRTAMLAARTDHQALAETAIAQLARHGSLAEPLTLAAREGVDAAARILLVRRTADALRDDLLIAALEHGVNKSLPVERLLTALRRVLLLEVPAARFEDKALLAFALVLMKQCAANEHVWAEAPQEAARITQLLASQVTPERDSFEASRVLLLAAMYRPLTKLMASGEAVQGLKLRALRDWLSEQLEAVRAEIALAASLTPDTAPGDATSQRVARQYEAAPYPRWTSLTLPNSGAIKIALRRYFAAGRLAFMDAGFDVLIAGCGTGRQAIQSALGYGPQARVQGIDMSARSLAYALRMSQNYAVPNVRFEQANLLAPDSQGHSYDIIECIGVLHHLADPFAGWRSLLGRLRPQGLMLIGLYSAVSREVLAKLRAEPGYPGASCSDEAARAYRQSLFAREANAPGGDLVLSKDAYTLSEFRDLALHAQERPVTLAEIEAFLSKERLVFRGFVLPGDVVSGFRKQFPDAGSLLRLADWAVYEAAHPNLFDAMYCFWCERQP